MNIYKGLDPELRVKCTPVTDFNDELTLTIREMLRTMRQHGGLGLAANQVGLDKRIIVIDVIRPKVLINPVIYSYQGQTFGREGCLSLPGIMTEKVRAKMIKVKYKNIFGVEKRETFKKKEAIVIQHEVDHLNGILMNDVQSEIGSVLHET
jgi:peptide deformylase